MEFPEIAVSIRPRRGKGPARRLRKRGQAPAVLYGDGVNSLCLSVSPKELAKALSGPLHTNTVLTLNINGDTGQNPKELKALVWDHQYDPVSRELLHVDFMAVNLEKKLHVKVPLKIEGRSLGEQAGGKLTMVYRTLPIEVLPGQIPAAITGDVSNLQLNEALAVSALKLPEGVTVTLPAETTLVLVQTARVEVEEVAETAEEGAAEAAEGEAEGEEKPSDEAEGEKE